MDQHVTANEARDRMAQRSSGIPWLRVASYMSLAVRCAASSRFRRTGLNARPIRGSPEGTLQPRRCG